MKVALDVLDHHDGIVDDKPHGQDDREEREKAMVNPATIIRKTAPTSEIGMATG